MSLRVIVPLAVVALGSYAGARPPLSSTEIEELREQGPKGLQSFLTAHHKQLEAEDPVVLSQLDQVCGQFDCKTSRLYWHTDLESAKAQARHEKKPILSLHLLGRLDEAQSCANSRFFRKVLYADPTLAGLLRSKFVLHWKSVRPVPKVTIDFGDGRVVKRTLTGNSAHYILDEEGRPLDVLPGLFAPQPFRHALLSARVLADEVRGLEGRARQQRFIAFHQRQLDAATKRWSEELATVGADAKVPKDVPSHVGLNLLELATNDETWDRMANLDRPGRAVAREVRDALANGFPDAWASGQIALTKAVVENPTLGAVRRIEWTLARDSIRNEYQLHGRIHAWFAAQRVPSDLSLESLNELVYASIFKAPLSDPWYGLGVPEDFQSIEDGVTLTDARR